MFSFQFGASLYNCPQVMYHRVIIQSREKQSPMTTPILVQIEEDKHWWFATRTRTILALLDQYAGADRERRKVLDVGAGAGNMMHQLAQYGDIVGLEYNPKPILVAHERGFDVRQGSATDMPFTDNSFDIVALLDTVEHIVDETTVLRECWRVTKPGGIMVVTVPAFMWLWSHNDVLNQHERRYTVPELKKKLSAVGWQVPYGSYNFTSIFPLSAGLILLRKLTRTAPDMASPHFDDDAYQVEMEPAPSWLNSLLDALGKVEVALLRRMSLPFGTSIITIARKPA